MLINWLKVLLGFNAQLDKKRKQLDELRHQVLLAQRDGDRRKAGELSKSVHQLEDEIIALQTIEE